MGFPPLSPIPLVQEARSHLSVDSGSLPASAMEIPAKRPRIHVVELAPFGFRFYKGSYDSFEDAPPRYTWQKVDYRVDDTVVYADLQGSEPMSDNLVFM